MGYNGPASIYLKKAAMLAWEEEFKPTVVEVEWLDRRYKKVFRNNGSGDIVTRCVGGAYAVDDRIVYLYKGDCRDVFVVPFINQMKKDFKGKDKFVALPDTLEIVINDGQQDDITRVFWKCYGVVVKKSYFKRRTNNG